YTYQERSFIVLSFCALFSEQKRGSLRWRGHRDPVLLPKGWVLLQHYLIAFLQSAEHFCFGAIGDAQIYGELLLAVLIVRAWYLHGGFLVFVVDDSVFGDHQHTLVLFQDD